MKKSLARSIMFLVAYLITPIFFLITLLIALLARRRIQEPEKARLVWGPIPIISNKYWSQTMSSHGYVSQTYMYNFYDRINQETDYDEYVFRRLAWCPLPIKIILLFWESLFRFDVFFITFEGWLLGKSPYWFTEAFFLNLAGKKVVAMPYGADSYLYKNVRSLSLTHGLNLSYPDLARQQDRIERQLMYWTKHADAVLPGSMLADVSGRWNVIMPSIFCVDENLWGPSRRRSDADGKNDTVYISHAPNHTGFKGTEFIEQAITALKEEGLKVEFLLLQNLQNEEVRRILMEDVDIHVEQIIFPIHGFNALESMSCGIPTIINLEDDDYTAPYRRWSFLNECPAASANPETIQDTLRHLVKTPALRRQLGEASHKYIEKYHSMEAGFYLHSHVIKYLYGEIDHLTLMNLYHPILGDYSRKHPKIETPLVNNRIVS